MNLEQERNRVKTGMIGKWERSQENFKKILNETTAAHHSDKDNK